MFTKRWIQVTAFHKEPVWMSIPFDPLDKSTSDRFVMLGGGHIRLHWQITDTSLREVPVIPPWVIDYRLGDETFQQEEQGHGWHGYFEPGKESISDPSADAGQSGDTPPTDDVPPVDLNDNTWETSGQEMTVDSFEQALNQKPDGGSVKPSDGSQPQTGFNVAGVQQQLPFTANMHDMAQQMYDHTQANPDLYARSDMYVGWWLQRDDAGNPVAFVVEPSQKVENPATAALLGVQRNQDSIWNNAQGIFNKQEELVKGLPDEHGKYSDGTYQTTASIPCGGNGKFGEPNANYAPNCTAFGPVGPAYQTNSDPNGPYVNTNGSTTADLNLSQHLQDLIEANLAKLPGMKDGNKSVRDTMYTNFMQAAQGFTCAEVAFGLTAYPMYHNEAQRVSDTTQNSLNPISPTQVAGMIGATMPRTAIAVTMGATDFIAQAVANDTPVDLPLDILYQTNELTGGDKGVPDCNIQNGVALSKQPNLTSASQALMKMMVQSDKTAPLAFGAKKDGSPLELTPSFWQRGMDKAIQIAMGHEFGKPDVPVTNSILGAQSGAMKGPDFVNNIIDPNATSFSTMDTVMVRAASGGQCSSFGKVNDSPAVIKQGEIEWKGGSYPFLCDANERAAADFGSQVGFPVSSIEMQAMQWAHEQDRTSGHSVSGTGSQGVDSINPTVGDFPPASSADLATPGVPQARDVTDMVEALDIIAQGPSDSAVGPVGQDLDSYEEQYSDKDAQDCKQDVASRLADHCTSSAMDLINAATPIGAYPDDVFDAQLLEAPTLSIYREPELKQAACSELISHWAGTSNDSSAHSLAVQESAKTEFGLQNTMEWSPHPMGNDNPSYVIQSDTKQTVDEHGPVLQDFLRSQYTDTQQMLKDQNVGSITLFRGQTEAPTPLNVEKTDLNNPGVIPTAQMRPMSSWSASYDVASRFCEAHGGVLMTAQVPASQILSTPRTGFGCLNEHEFVVLGNVDDVKVETPDYRVVALEAAGGVGKGLKGY